MPFYVSVKFHQDLFGSFCFYSSIKKLTIELVLRLKSLNGLAGRTCSGLIIFKKVDKGVEHYCGSWFFVLVSFSPKDVGALQAQLTQRCDLVPVSADSRDLARCWQVCQHGFHFTHSPAYSPLPLTHPSILLSFFSTPHLPSKINKVR